MEPFTTIADQPIQWPERQIDMDMALAIKQYVEDKRPVGGFLRALLANDLTDAATRADKGNALTLADLAKFAYWNVPAHLRGSRERVNAHIGAE